MGNIRGDRSHPIWEQRRRVSVYFDLIKNGPKAARIPFMANNRNNTKSMNLGSIELYSTLGLDKAASQQGILFWFITGFGGIGLFRAAIVSIEMKLSAKKSQRIKKSVTEIKWEDLSRRRQQNTLYWYFPHNFWGAKINTLWPTGNANLAAPRRMRQKLCQFVTVSASYCLLWRYRVISFILIL